MNLLPGTEDIGLAAVYTGLLLDGATIPFTPSELFLSLTGYVCATGDLHFGAAYAISVIGAMTGHLMSYSVGARIGHPFVKRYGQYLFLPTDRFEALITKTKKYGPQAAFVFRFIPGFRSVASILLGIARMPFVEFIVLTTFATMIWNVLWMIAGYYFGLAFSAYADKIIPFALGIIVAGIFTWGFLWWRQSRKNKKYSPASL